MQLPRDWDVGLGAGSGSFTFAPCEQFTMNWTMTDPTDSPAGNSTGSAGYLPAPLWNVDATVDSSDATGATWNIVGSYTGSWTGAPGSAVTSPITLDSTDKFTINSVTFSGLATAGACAPAPGTNPGGSVVVPVPCSQGDPTSPAPAGSDNCCPSGLIYDPASGFCVVTLPVKGPGGGAGCSAGQVVDSVTGGCVAPCPGGSVPAGGVCPSASTGTGTYVAIGAGVLGVGTALYFLLR